MAYTKEQRKAKEQSEQVADAVIALPIEEEKEPIENIPLNATVWVKNNSVGKLVYVSKRTGFLTEWQNNGADQPMSLEELIMMRNTYIKFFKSNWITIKGFVSAKYKDLYSVEEIYEFLQVKQYYTSSLCPNNLDDVFQLTPEEILKRVPNMSAGVRSSILIRANDLIESKKIDSISVVEALEKALNCELYRTKG